MDHLHTHLALLKSNGFLERALNKRDLASLKAFTNVGDPVAAIQAGLTVTRDPMGGGIIVLGYRGASADESVTILGAVLESYQEYLDIIYRHNDSDPALELWTKAVEVLRNDLAHSEEQYRKLRQSGSLTTQVDRAASAERLTALERKKTELLLRQVEVRVELKQAEDDARRLDLQIDAHVWAAKVGFDKLPKSVQDLGQVVAYKAHLKEMLARLAARPRRLWSNPSAWRRKKTGR